MERLKHIFLLLPLLLLASCGDYQAVLKSKDPEFKYEKALEYFERGKYIRSQTLLDDVASYFKGTPRSEEVLIYLCRSYLGQKNYTEAADYYQAYTRSYPKGKYAAEAHYQVGHCKALDAPDPRLDQTTTREAIEAYQNFVDLYPESSYAKRAYDDIAALYDKLALKELYSARLYYNLGTYLGNNYLSCQIVSQNAMRDYPANKYTEEFAYLIMASKCQQAIYSMPDKQLERARDAQDECYSFLSEYPNSKHRNQAERFDQQMRKYTHE